MFPLVAWCRVGMRDERLSGTNIGTITATAHGPRGAERESLNGRGAVPVAKDPLGYAVIKRAVDFTVSLVLIVAFSWLFALIALFIKLTSPGPIIYRQTRVGRGGRPFTFYKFRSMIVGADQMIDAILHMNTTNGPTFKNPNDPRVTPVGRILRKTSLDELPQLFNVLRGDMSLVGPRPPLASEVAEYSEYELQRLAVMPGLTCLWQVNGRSDLTFREQVELDLEYIRRRGLWTDLCILLRTIPAVVTGRGAC